MGKLKVWLKSANGWKRLWFVLSILLIIYLVLVNPVDVRNGVFHRTGIMNDNILLMAVGAGFILSLVLSALAYLLGVIVAWVISRFSKKS